jgi:hypothetical protein
MADNQKMWLAIAIVAVLFVLLLNGMIHQERFILWKEHKDGMAEKLKIEADLKKRAAKDRIKGMLRDVRRRTDDPAVPAVAAQSQPPPAPPPQPAAPESRETVASR